MVQIVRRGHLKQLVVSQVNGEYEARDATMTKYLQLVKDEIGKLKYFSLVQVPRSENNQADALSKLASSALCDTPRSVFWEVKEQRSIEHAEVQVLNRTSTWMNDILAYKLNGTLPSDPREAKKLKKKAEWFEVFKGELYKKKGLLKAIFKVCDTGSWK